MQKEVSLRDLSPMIGSLNTFVQMPLPVKYSFRLSKVMKVLQDELQQFETAKQDLFKKLGEPAESDSDNQQPNMQGTQYKIKPENIDQFQTEMQQLLEEEITLEFNPIPLSVVEETNMTIADMVNLEIFFEDDSEEGKD